MLVSDLPPHLRGERALASYFEGMGMCVESVSLCREVGGLKGLIGRRTEALVRLEKAWTDYLGNPSSVDVLLDPSESAVPPLIDLEDGHGGHSNSNSEGRPSVVVPHRKRPTVRPGWFKPKTDALEYYERWFREADAAVQQRRRTGKFRAAQTAFVTFEKMSSAVSLSPSRHYFFFPLRFLFRNSIPLQITSSKSPPK